MDASTYMLGASMLPSVIGTGQKVSVPGSMARPEDPRKTILDDTGFVQDQFKISNFTDPSQTTATGLLGNLQNRATQTGPSQSAQHLMGASDLEAQAQKDQAVAGNNSSMATQEANMAMKGGLGTGSRERMASTANTGLMNTNNSINQQNSLNKMNTLAGDEQQKLGILQGLPDQYMDMAKFNTGKKQTDINNSIGTSTDLYNSEMGAWAGNQMAIGQAKQFNASQKGMLGGLF